MLIDQIRNVSVFVALVFGMMATLWGFSQMALPTAWPFAWDSLLSYVLFLLAGTVLLGVLSSWLKVSRLATGAIVALAITILTSTIWPLIVTIWIGFASYVVGGAILALLKVNREILPNLTVALVGAGAYGTAVGLAAHFPINYPGLYALALAAPVVLGWRSVYATARSFGQYYVESSVSKWHDLAIALVALVHFSVALMPEVGHDALAMHLFIPGHLATRHEWGFDVNTYVWAVMPMMGDWLFSIGYMLAGETAARLINVGFIFILSWLIRELVIWAGGSAVGARWAVLLFLTTPLTFTESSSLFIESVWATFIIAGSLSVFKLSQGNKDLATHLSVASFLLGGALAAKAVTLTILPVLPVLLIFSFRVWGRRNLVGALALGLVLFVSVGSIPYITAWYLTDNPVFPFFNHIFRSSMWPALAFEAPTAFGKGLTWDVIYQSTFHTETFLEAKPGTPGFTWLLLFFPALLVLMFYRQHKGLILITVAVLSIALTFQSLTYLRYIFPSFVWVATAIGVAISTVEVRSGFLKKVLTFAGWLVVFLNLVFFNSGTHYGDLFINPLLSSSDRESYLNSRLPIRNSIKLVNMLNIGQDPVAVFSSPLTAGLASDGLYPNWYNQKFQAKVNSTATAEDMAQLLLSQGVFFVVLDNNWGAAVKRRAIEDVTEKLSEQGSISVRKLKSSYLFQTELLVNSNLASCEEWTLSTGLGCQSDNITVSVSSPAFQVVSVTPGRTYQNTVSTICADQLTQGRMQVNWLDSNSVFISTDIQVFDCEFKETTLAMVVKSPRNAAYAVVYASGHTSMPITFNKVSFKQ